MTKRDDYDGSVYLTGYLTVAMFVIITAAVVAVLLVFR